MMRQVHRIVQHAEHGYLPAANSEEDDMSRIGNARRFHQIAGMAEVIAHHAGPLVGRRPNTGARGIIGKTVERGGDQSLVAITRDRAEAFGGPVQKCGNVSLAAWCETPRATQLSRRPVRPRRAR